MKKCPGCGKIYEEQDQFCDTCGKPLVSMTNGQKKSGVPILIGCAAAVILLIGGTVIGVRALNGKKEKVEPSQTFEQTSIQQKNERLEPSEEMDKEGADLSDTPIHEEETASEENTEKTEALKEEENVEAEEEIKEERSSQAEEGDTAKYETYFVVNCQESITLRKSPSTGAAEICQIPFGAAVSYVETAENGFYKIIYNGKTGYGLASYLDVTPQASPRAAASTDSKSYTTCYVVNCKESITLRKSASTKAGEICQIPLGAAVSFASEAENGFYKIIYNGKTGYGLASYLSFQQATSTASYMQVVKCRESITLRKTPSTKGEQFCQIPLGAVVEYLGTAENGFYMVSYNGYTGYALASYLETY